MDVTSSAPGRQRRRGLRMLLAASLLPVLAACSGVPGLYVVEKPGQAAAGPQAFDATTYVDGIWDSRVVPTVTSGAVPAATLLPALAKDKAAASQQYGKQAGSGAPYAFLVKGSGKVTDVADNGAVGTMTVKVDGVRSQVRLAIGPAFVGTSVRDAVGFIDFSQFTNQLDYAGAATALNAKVKSTVVDQVDPGSVKGKTVTFAGAFSLLDPTAVTVTPVTLEVAP